MKNIKLLLFAFTLFLFSDVSAQKRISFECFDCRKIDQKDCDVCKTGEATNVYLNGLVVRFDNAAPVTLHKPFEIWTKGRTVYVQDWKGTKVSIPARKTVYSKLNDLVDAITACNCGEDVVDTNTTYSISGPVAGPNGDTYSLVDGDNNNAGDILIPSILDETGEFIPVTNASGDTVGYNYPRSGSNGESFTEGFTLPIQKGAIYNIRKDSFCVDNMINELVRFDSAGITVDSFVIETCKYCIPYECTPDVEDLKVEVTSDEMIKVDLDSLTGLSTTNPDESLVFGLLDYDKSTFYMDRLGLLYGEWENNTYVDFDTLTVNAYAECKLSCQRDTFLIQFCREQIKQICALDIDFTEPSSFQLNNTGISDPDIIINVVNKSNPLTSIAYATGSVYDNTQHFALGEPTLLEAGVYEFEIVLSDGTIVYCTETIEVTSSINCSEGVSLDYNGPLEGLGASKAYVVDIAPGTEYLSLYANTVDVADTICVFYNQVEIFNSGNLVTGSSTEYFGIDIPYNGTDNFEFIVKPDISTGASNTVWEVAFACCNAPVCPVDDALFQIGFVNYSESACRQSVRIDPNAVNVYDIYDAANDQFTSGTWYESSGIVWGDEPDCYSMNPSGNSGCVGGGYSETTRAIAATGNCELIRLDSFFCQDFTAPFSFTSGGNINTIGTFDFANLADLQTFRTFVETYSNMQPYEYLQVQLREESCTADGAEVRIRMLPTFAGVSSITWDEPNLQMIYDPTSFAETGICCVDDMLTTRSSPSAATVLSVIASNVFSRSGLFAGTPDPQEETTYTYYQTNQCGDITQTYTYLYDNQNSYGTWEYWGAQGDLPTAVGQTLIGSHDNFTPYGFDCERILYLVNADGTNVSCDPEAPYPMTVDLTAFGAGVITANSPVNIIGALEAANPSQNWSTLNSTCGQFWTLDDTSGLPPTPVTVQ